MKKCSIYLLLLLMLITPTSFTQAQSASSPTFCYNFNRDVYTQIIPWINRMIDLSSKNEESKIAWQETLTKTRTDIANLHTVLAKEKIIVGNEVAVSSRTYGTSTAEAVASLQSKLKSTNPSVRVNGILDTPTRSAINNLYGCFGKIVVDLVQPNNNVTFSAGQTVPIKYNISKIPVGTTADLKISYVPVVAGKEGTAVDITTVSNVTNGNNKVYTWTIPEDISPASYKIQVQVVDKNNPESGLKSDKSTRTFSILSTEVSLVVPASPAIHWKKGEINTFTLKKSNSVGPLSVSISRLNNEGEIIANQQSLILFPSLTTTGVITVPANKTKDLEVGSYKLQTRTTAMGDIVVGTSNTFEVVNPSIVVTTPTAPWISGSPQTITITKTSSVGNVRVDAVPFVEGSFGQPKPLVASANTPSIALKGTQTATLSAGTYILRVTQVGTGIMGESSFFEVKDPTITITTPEKWAKGNPQRLIIAKDIGVGNVKVTAIPQGTTAGGPIVLVPTTDKASIAIPKEKTKLLSVGTYKIEVTAVVKNTIKNVSDEFEVQTPGVSIENKMGTWKPGSPAQLNLIKDDLIKSPVSISIIPLDKNDVPTGAGKILLPNVETKGLIVVPAARIGSLPEGRYKVEVRTTTGLIYSAETESFEIKTASATSQLFSNLVGSVSGALNSWVSLFTN